MLQNHIDVDTLSPGLWKLQFFLGLKCHILLMLFVFLRGNMFRTLCWKPVCLVDTLDPNCNWDDASSPYPKIKGIED